MESLPFLYGSPRGKYFTDALCLQWQAQFWTCYVGIIIAIHGLLVGSFIFARLGYRSRRCCGIVACTVSAPQYHRSTIASFFNTWKRAAVRRPREDARPHTVLVLKRGEFYNVHQAISYGTVSCQASCIAYPSQFVFFLLISCPRLRQRVYEYWFFFLYACFRFVFYIFWRLTKEDQVLSHTAVSAEYCVHVVDIYQPELEV